MRKECSGWRKKNYGAVLGEGGSKGGRHCSLERERKRSWTMSSDSQSQLQNESLLRWHLKTSSIFFFFTYIHIHNSKEMFGAVIAVLVWSIIKQTAMFKFNHLIIYQMNSWSLILLLEIPIRYAGDVRIRPYYYLSKKQLISEFKRLITYRAIEFCSSTIYQAIGVLIYFFNYLRNMQLKFSQLFIYEESNWILASIVLWLIK